MSPRSLSGGSAPNPGICRLMPIPERVEGERFHPPALFRSWPPSRRSSCFPAELYPPLGPPTLVGIHAARASDFRQGSTSGRTALPCAGRQTFRNAPRQTFRNPQGSGRSWAAATRAASQATCSAAPGTCASWNWASPPERARSRGFVTSCSASRLRPRGPGFRHCATYRTRACGSSSRSRNSPVVQRWLPTAPLDERDDRRTSTAAVVGVMARPNSPQERLRANSRAAQRPNRRAEQAMLADDGWQTPWMPALTAWAGSRAEPPAQALPGSVRSCR